MANQAEILCLIRPLVPNGGMNSYQLSILLFMKKNHWAIVLLSLPILISFAYFFRFAVDSPWFDDVEAIPAFVLDFFRANTWSQKIDLLLKPNNEHRILFTKLMSLLSVGLLGKLNFVFLMLLGNLCVLGIFWLFYKNFKPNNLSLLY